jgi:uncharacterized protein with PQ loop repeat
MAKRHKHHNLPHIHLKKSRDPFDYVVYAFSFITPLFELPQLWEIYSNHSAENVSLTTWVFFCVDNLVWMIYGFRKKEWPIFLTSAIYQVFEVAIVIGILLYN